MGPVRSGDRLCQTRLIPRSPDGDNNEVDYGCQGHCIAVYFGYGWWGEKIRILMLGLQWLCQCLFPDIVLLPTGTSGKGLLIFLWAHPHFMESGDDITRVTYRFHHFSNFRRVSPSVSVKSLGLVWIFWLKKYGYWLLLIKLFDCLEIIWKINKTH